MKEKIKPFEIYKGKIRRQLNILNDKISYVNLLSVYDMLLCEKMAKTLALRLINEGSEEKQAIDISENACLSTMCLTDESSEPIFNNVTKLMESLTAEDILIIVKEYNSLRNDYMGFDELNNDELECIKKN